MQVVASSSALDAAGMRRLEGLVNGMESAGELRLVSRQGDRRLAGRVHENLQQFHRGVPVHGGGVTRQRNAGATVSVLGTLHRGIDVDTAPVLSVDEAVARATASAGTGPAGDGAPRFTVLPTPLGRYVLTYRVVMKDMSALFIDAFSGEVARRDSLIHEQQPAAVGSGRGVTGQTHKLSVTATSRLIGEGFETRDQLRGAEIVTLDMRGDEGRLGWLFEPENFWEPQDLGFDLDNAWESEDIADVHANAGLVYDYLQGEQQWNALDGRDGRIVLATNLFGFPNAAFVLPPFGPEGNGGLVFGGGFGSLDIVGHEMMHGVTHFSVLQRTGSGFGSAHTYIPGPSAIHSPAGDAWFRCGDSWTFPDETIAPLLCEDGRILLFWNEGGAINEALSDIVGAAAEFAFHPPGQGPLRADYVLGEDVGKVGRVLNNPEGSRLAPGVVYPDAVGRGFRFVVARVGENLIRYVPIVHYRDRFFALQSAYDGIHWNSTILSHSFYLAVEGGRHHSSGADVAGAGGANRDRVARAYVRAMTELMPVRGTFAMMAAAVRQSAVDLYGADSVEHAAVDQALSAVGLAAR